MLPYSKSFKVCVAIDHDPARFQTTVETPLGTVIAFHSYTIGKVFSIPEYIAAIGLDRAVTEPKESKEIPKESKEIPELSETPITGDGSQLILTSYYGFQQIPVTHCELYDDGVIFSNKDSSVVECSYVFNYDGDLLFISNRRTDIGIETLRAFYPSSKLEGCDFIRTETGPDLFSFSLLRARKREEIKKEGDLYTGDALTYFGYLETELYSREQGTELFYMSNRTIRRVKKGLGENYRNETKSRFGKLVKVYRSGEIHFEDCIDELRKLESTIEVPVEIVKKYVVYLNKKLVSGEGNGLDGEIVERGLIGMIAEFL